MCGFSERKVSSADGKFKCGEEIDFFFKFCVTQFKYIDVSLYLPFTYIDVLEYNFRKVQKLKHRDEFTSLLINNVA